MQSELLWDELLALVTQMGIEVQWSRGNFRGGLYSTQGIRRLLLNDGYSREWQLRIIGEELGRLDLSSFYVPPAVRAFIERQKSHGLQPASEPS